MPPSFRIAGEASSIGSQRILRMPVPARKNIENAKLPNTGRYRESAPRRVSLHLPITKPVAIKPSTRENAT
jgi:hypothetical protein